MQRIWRKFYLPVVNEVGGDFLCTVYLIPKSPACLTELPKSPHDTEWDFKGPIGRWAETQWAQKALTLPWPMNSMARSRKYECPIPCVQEESWWSWFFSLSNSWVYSFGSLVCSVQGWELDNFPEDVTNTGTCSGQFTLQSRASHLESSDWVELPWYVLYHISQCPSKRESAVPSS